VATLLLAGPHGRRPEPAGSDRRPQLALRRLPQLLLPPLLATRRTGGRVPPGREGHRGTPRPRPPGHRRGPLDPRPDVGGLPGPLRRPPPRRRQPPWHAGIRRRALVRRRAYITGRTRTPDGCRSFGACVSGDRPGWSRP